MEGREILSKEKASRDADQRFDCAAVSHLLVCW